MTVVVKTIAAINTREEDIGVKKPQIKNTVLVLSSNISLVNRSSTTRDKYQNWLIEQIISITYLYKTKPRSYPRVNKAPKNRWKMNRPQRIQEFVNIELMG